MITEGNCPAIQAFLWPLSDLSQLQSLSKTVFSNHGFD
jgi:hypothetical protein